MTWNIPVLESSVEEFNYILNNFPHWGGEEIQRDCFVSILPLISIYHGKKRRGGKLTIPSMIELGCSGTNGSVYSMLFEKYFNYCCINVCTEPDSNLLSNMRIAWKDRHLTNAALYAGYSGKFIGIGNQHNFNPEELPILKMKFLMEQNNIKELDIFHCDIQGSEISVLEELISDNLLKQIRFFFISVHGMVNNVDTYTKCKELLESNLRQVRYYFSDPTQGGCGDGLIVAENLEFVNLA